MHIDSYQFGEIVVDGATYRSDLIILGGTVRPDWWRKQGHVLSADDLGPVIAARPSVLVVGCGASGLMEVPDQTRRILRENDIEVESLATAEAVERFNELAQQGSDVAAALHLTC